MSNECYYRLNIDVTDALNPSWRMPTPTSDYGIWYPSARMIFSKGWLDKLAELDLYIHHALLFYRGPNMTSREAHVDTHAATHKFVNFALNWVIGGEHSEMHWYNMPADTSAATTVKDPKTNVPYTTYQFKDLTSLDTCNITNELTLVKTSVPHSITMGAEPRWCISARTNIKEDMPWDEVVDLLRSKNLLIER